MPTDLSTLIPRRAALATIAAVPAVAALPAGAVAKADDAAFLADAAKFQQLIHMATSTRLHWHQLREQILARPDCPALPTPPTRKEMDEWFAFLARYGDSDAADAVDAADDALRSAEEIFLAMQAPTLACVAERARLALLWCTEHEEIHWEHAEPWMEVIADDLEALAARNG